MKKGLVAFLIISISALLATLALTFILYNIEIISVNHTPVDSVAPTKVPVASKPSTPAPVTATPEMSATQEPIGLPEPTVTPIPTASPAADEDPVLPEVTPEPDMDPDTWDYLKGGDYNMRYLEKEKTPKVMPYLIKVNKQMNTVTIYKAGKKAKYNKAVKSMICSAGRGTPLGTFKTSDKYYWKAMIHNVWAQYATRITGQILFHSVPYDTHEKDTLVTNYYNQLGQTASAGCVRLSVEDAKWIAENCPSGTTVVIYNSSDPGPLGKPSAIKIPFGCTWDPTDPDNRNPWKSDKTAIIGVKNTTIERGTRFNIYTGVVAFDKTLNTMTTKGLKASKSPNTSKPGKYEVTFTYKPVKGKKIKKTATYTVVDTKAPSISGLPTKLYIKDATKITQKFIYNKISVSDNNLPLSKKEHVNISLAGNSALITAHDDYNHVTRLKVSFIEDSKAPVITLKNNTEKTIPVSQSISEKQAVKRIKSVSDNKMKLSQKDVSISVKPSGWGLKITYSVKDAAGNKTTVSETLTYETASMHIINPNLVVSDIDDYDELKKNISVLSDVTGKPVKYEFDVDYTYLSETETHEQYSVKYTAIYKSQAGKKKLTASSIVSVLK